MDRVQVRRAHSAACAQPYGWPDHAKAAGELGFARVAQELAARAQHDRQLTGFHLETLKQRLSLRIAVRLQPVLWMTVAAEEVLQAQNVAAFRMATIMGPPTPASISPTRRKISARMIRSPSSASAMHAFAFSAAGVVGRNLFSSRDRLTVDVGVAVGPRGSLGTRANSPGKTALMQLDGIKADLIRFGIGESRR